MKWTKGMDMGFRVGQTVYAFGLECKVSMIRPDSRTYPVHVTFNNGSTEEFMLDGRLHEDHEAPSLFHTPQTYDIELPKYEPQEGEVCWMYVLGNEMPYLTEMITINEYDYIIKFYGDVHKMVYKKNHVTFKPFKGELP